LENTDTDIRNIEAAGLSSRGYHRSIFTKVFALPSAGRYLPAYPAFCTVPQAANDAWGEDDPPPVHPNFVPAPRKAAQSDQRLEPVRRDVAQARKKEESLCS